MNEVTRGPVFETNSSSTHSLSIVTGPNFKVSNTWRALLSDDESELILTGEEFWWESDEFSDSPTKIAYLVAHCCASLPWDSDAKYPAGSFIEVPDSEDWRALCRVLSAETSIPVERIKVESRGGYHPVGYIDHQSNHVPSDVFAGGDDAIRRFVFDDGSVLRTDNDNH